MVLLCESKNSNDFREYIIIRCNKIKKVRFAFNLIRGTNKAEYVTRIAFNALSTLI